MKNHPQIVSLVEQYYANKIREHGPTGKGVDWNGEVSQVLRFDQFLRLLPQEQPFSILDFGCGYGALFDYYRNLFPLMDYHGYDISLAMIESATQLFGHSANFSTSLNTQPKKDFLIASGVFNVKVSHTDNEWKGYVIETLSLFNTIATKGFGFNILSSYSDKEKQKGHLFYADPLWFFDYCKRNFSRNVSLLHDYGLYEFTILINKTK